MRAFNISKRDSRSILDELRKNWPPIMLSKVRTFKIVEVDEGRSLLLSDSFTAVRVKGLILPSLSDARLLEAFPSVTVNQGAVSHLCNGANIMRPGIVSLESEFEEGEIVAVREEAHKKHIAVGMALVSKQEALLMDKGPIIKNIHYVGDRLWEALKTTQGKPIG